MKPFLQEVAEDLVAKYGDRLHEYAIVFNNKRPASYLNKHLAQLYNKPFWSPQVYTIQEFVSLSAQQEIADFYQQFFTLHRLYNGLLAQEAAGHISMDKFFSIGKIILGDFSQIDMDMVDSQQLFKELEDIAVINEQFDFLTEEQHQFLSRFWLSYSEGKHKKQQENFIRMWRRMPQLYSLFHAALSSNKLVTLGKAYRQLAETPALDSFLDNLQIKKVIFVGFNALSRSEAVIFKRWQEQDKAVFYFDTDSYYLEDELQEAGLFLRKNIHRHELINQLDNDRSYIKALARPVDVYQVQGQVTQAKILSIILEKDYEILKENPDYGDTAIILADESLIMPTLQTIPTTIHGSPIPINVTMGISFGTSSIFGLADLWLNIQASLHHFSDKEEASLPYATIEAFLSHPLTDIDETLRSELLRTYVSQNQTVIPTAALVDKNPFFQQFFTRISDPLSFIRGLKDVFAYLLNKLIASQNLKKTDASLFFRSIEELNRLSETLHQYIAATPDEPLEHKFTISLIRSVLEGISVPLSGSPLAGLQVMGLLESRNLNFDHVILLGLNDGMIPKTSLGTSFIPDNIRRAYDLPVLENLDAVSAYMFYRIIQRADKISLVYNTLSDESNSGEPSRFLKQLEFESGFHFRYHEQSLPIQLEYQETRSIPKTKAIMERLAQFTNGSRSLSASSLTTYIANPIDFFFKEIARIKEPEEVSEVVEANNLGTILHATMEIFYKQLQEENPYITAERLEKKAVEIPLLVKESYVTEFYKDQMPPKKISGNQKIILAIIEEYAHMIIKKDISSAPFVLIDTEVDIVETISFETSTGEIKDMYIKGIVDRVDQSDNGLIRIVDYKTGSDELQYESIAEAFNTHGNKLNKALVQTLFYTYLYEKSTQQKHVEPNLYVLRKMRNMGVLFHSKEKVTNPETGKSSTVSHVLKADILEAEKAKFLSLFKEKLQELFDPSIDFVISENEDNYLYSPYQELYKS